MKFIFKLLCVCILTTNLSTAFAYNQPPINLGFTSFQDGGPPGPVQPGLMVQVYLQYFESNRFLDNNGKRLPLVKHPHFSTWIWLTQFLYTTKVKFLNANIGFDFLVPVVASSNIHKNQMQLKTSGAGFGDLIFGPYLQWGAIMKGKAPVFVTRLEVYASFPTGKEKFPTYAINPGSNIYTITPYWAATWFFAPKFSTSWRLHYTWCSKNSKTHIQPGQSVYVNYTLDYAVKDNLFAGLNGYYFKQITDDKLSGTKIPDSREQVLGMGPGILYMPTKTVQLYVNLYFESYVRNRPDGTRLNLRAVKVF